jgi:hypothetical protein
MSDFESFVASAKARAEEKRTSRRGNGETRKRVVDECRAYLAEQPDADGIDAAYALFERLFPATPFPFDDPTDFRDCIAAVSAIKNACYRARK